MTAARLEDELKKVLPAGRLGLPLHVFPAVDSTNTVAHGLARGGATHGTLVVAVTQTGGKGRFGREWISPPGGLWFSLVLRPSLTPQHLGLLPLAMAVAALEGIISVAGIQAPAHGWIRWPNDLMIGRKKFCGILVESEISGGMVQYAIAGIGINLNIKVEEIPMPVREEATSLLQETGRCFSSSSVLSSVLSRIHQRTGELEEGEGQLILQEWKNYDGLAGRKILVEEHRGSGSGSWEGKALGITEEGFLKVLDNNGAIRSVVTQRVRLLYEG